MKFARYLDANCTQEWKRAYIDYKRLKKCIKAVALAQEASSTSSKSQGGPGQTKQRPRGGTGDTEPNEDVDGTFVKTSDEDDDRDDDSDSDRDQGPWAGHKPSFSKKNRDIKLENGEGSKTGFWLGRKPSFRIGKNAGQGTQSAQRGQGEQSIPTTKISPVVVSSSSPPKSSAMLAAPPPRPDPGTTPRDRSPVVRTTPGIPAKDRTCRQYGAMGYTPPANRKRDPSPPPPLKLPEASGLPPTEVNENGKPMALSGESTIISPDDSLEESPFDGDERKPSEGSDGKAVGDGDVPGPLPSTGLIQPDNRLRTPSILRFGRSQTGDITRSPKVDGRTAGSSPGSAQIQGIKSPRLQAALGSLRRATTGGTDPLPRSSLTKATTLEDGVGVRFPSNLDELYSCLNVPEAKFFDVLDGELSKVDNFYSDRLQDAIKRCHELRDQLQELGEHRKIFHEAEDKERKGGDKVVMRNLIPGTAGFTSAISQSVQRGLGRVTRPNGDNARQRATDKREKSQQGDRSKSQNPAATTTDNGHPAQADDRGRITEEQGRVRLARPEEFSPELYQKYKRKLRVAVMEYYKELEVLKNYRILNVTGFKKALKKFEKTAKIQCLDLYMKEKVARATFHDGDVLDGLIKEMEDEYTIRFERGNRKQAVNKLRGTSTSTTHYYSTFLSGTYIGLGLPALVLGLVRSFDPSIREALPQYNALLLVYSVFFIPVIFAMLLELNLAAFVHARINYTFIMEIDIRTAIDYRCFLEIPALLFCILCYCLYFSITRVGDPQIMPWAWPIVWLVFMVVFILNPIPMYYQHARYWLLSVIGRVLTPGYSRVEFIAFFVADELNSLVYSISNLWFIGCAYNKGWSNHPDMYTACSAGGNWVYSLLLVIPALIRAIQCLKRYKDSGLPIHLVNAGKYGSVMLQYALFALWRSKSWQTRDWSFAIWVTAATISSIYTSSWDLFVDWGLMRPSYGFLRESLGYSTKNYYYVAMVTNVIIRFIWIGYIPLAGLEYRSRAFTFAMLEMLRRWQWNFFRVETEQVGNTDQYRISKDVPLPYRLEPDESEDEMVRTIDQRSGRERWGWRSAAVTMDRLRKRVVSGAKEDVREVREAYHHGARGPPGTINAGPRGDYASRDYDRRLPPDDDDDSSVVADDPPPSPSSSGMHRRAEDL